MSAWTAVLPAKPFHLAKTRLHVPETTRRELARSFFLDTLCAVLATGPVTTVVVVTDDREVTELAEESGAFVVNEHPRVGLNEAVLSGASFARSLAPEASVAVLPTDLPALRPSELGHVLSLAKRHRRAYLPDHSGRGTTLLTATGGCTPRPAYEGASSSGHRRNGTRELTEADAPGARLDVDTAADLWAALRLGVGPHTARSLAAAGVHAGDAARRAGPGA
ncbi:2-phospho-L-lactate guanylyltransferase [Streptomyces griseorubiginosus]|uniref:2-phospho-L-lactate guanylyltransferase n=1 Tax=Streptomyces griseorubiginosus TaxID=67304 RepID=UPI00364D6245